MVANLTCKCAARADVCTALHPCSAKCRLRIACKHLQFCIFVKSIIQALDEIRCWEACAVYSSVSRRLLLANPFWLRKITMGPHILAHVDIVSGPHVSKIKNLYLRTNFTYMLIHTRRIRNNAMHQLTLNEITVARFVGTGCFLIRYSNGHTKLTYRQFKKFREYF